jgi:O-6-methylguanine DNA methyltransferase
MIGLFTLDIDDVWFGIACDEERIFSTSFAKNQQAVLSSLLEAIPFDIPFEAFSKPSPFAAKILFSMKAVYDGKGVSEIFPLAAEYLPNYTRRVLETCASIPVGYVTSYGAVAKATGGSARAVGGVMAANPFAPIVPCHRVVRSDLTVGGYSGGLSVKLAILGREKRGYKSKLDIPVSNKKLAVFPVERVLEKVKKKESS